MSEHHKEVLVFSERFNRHSYGPNHPLKVERLRITMDLIEAYGLFDHPESPWVEAREAEEQDVRLIHTSEYIEALRQANTGQTPPTSAHYGLGSGDNPVFPGLYDWSLLVTGATLECIRQVRYENRRIAFNIAGGLHHALSNRSSGFCYLNDPAIGIARMVQDGLRVVYLDLDVHHGDGVEAAFYNTDQVLTISIHQNGHTLFPGTGFPEEMGQGPGRGFAVNLPLAPGTDDDLYIRVFNETVPPLVRAFDPDVLVTQLGVDTFTSDPLASLNLTNKGFCKLIREIKSWGICWVALGGGGYDIMNVARAWTSAWATMKGVELSDDLPDDFVNKHRHLLGRNLKLTEQTPLISSVSRESTQRARLMADSGVAWIKEHIFPIVGV
jgi:acetoin utilization protein AcuC